MNANRNNRVDEYSFYYFIDFKSTSVSALVSLPGLGSESMITKQNGNGNSMSSFQPYNNFTAVFLSFCSTQAQQNEKKREIKNGKETP